jgi:hypothetical protein
MELIADRDREEARKLLDTVLGGRSAGEEEGLRTEAPSTARRSLSVSLVCALNHERFRNSTATTSSGCAIAASDCVTHGASWNSTNPSLPARRSGRSPLRTSVNAHARPSSPNALFGIRPARLLRSAYGSIVRSASGGRAASRW